MTKNPKSFVIDLSAIARRSTEALMVLMLLLLTGCSEETNNFNQDPTGPDGTVIEVTAQGTVTPGPGILKCLDNSECKEDGTVVPCRSVSWAYADTATNLITGSRQGTIRGETTFAGLPPGTYLITLTATASDGRTTSTRDFTRDVPDSASSSL